MAESGGFLRGAHYWPVAPLDGVPGSGQAEVNGFGRRNAEVVSSSALGISYDGPASDDAPAPVDALVMAVATPASKLAPMWAFEWPDEPD